MLPVSQTRLHSAAGQNWPGGEDVDDDDLTHLASPSGARSSNGNQEIAREKDRMEMNKPDCYGVTFSK